MKIDRYILFFPDKDKRVSSESGLLRMNVKYDAGSFSLSLGVRVTLSKWISDAQRVKANTTHGKHNAPAYEINKMIEHYAQVVDDSFYHYEKENVIPATKELKQYILVKLGKAQDVTNSLDYVGNMFITMESKNKSWEQRTINYFKFLFNDMQYSGIINDVNAIDDKYLAMYVEYLIDKGHRNVTTKKVLKKVFWFLRWSKRNGFYNGNSFETFQPKLKDVDKAIIFLTWEELMNVYSLDFEKNYLNKARDIFCLCCFTGLRYSDISKLKKEDIYNDCINVVTKKTNDSIAIDLNKYSRSILEKHGYDIPIISNAKMNKYLKEIGEIAGLNEKIRIVYYQGNDRKEEFIEKYKLLTTHCGRRTFVCNALMLGISPQVIMKWTGHSDIKSMKPYMEIADSYRKSEMGKFDKL